MQCIEGKNTPVGRAGDAAVTSSFELMFDMSIPYRVAINEGVELAKLYGGVDGHKYINGVLDKVAASVRPQEFRK